jgi:SAM-dependent methyltransferase
MLTLLPTMKGENTNIGGASSTAAELSLASQRTLNSMTRRPARIDTQLSPKEKQSSPFVLRCINSVELNRARPVLDIPCGLGRHSLLLLERGYNVVGADIDICCLTSLREQAIKDAPGRISLLKVDATSELPFRSYAFGLALIVHYVERSIISVVEPLIAPGGYLIYETFGFNGNNWQQLPQARELKNVVASNFELLVYQEKSHPKHAGHSVSVKVFARKKEQVSLGSEQRRN